MSILPCCNAKRDDSPVGFVNVTGTVIGNEICRSDSEFDYWLITLWPQHVYGDSVEYNGTKYRNVVKAQGIKKEFKIINKLLNFDCEISETKQGTTDCTVNPSSTFTLKTLRILRQRENP